MQSEDKNIIYNGWSFLQQFTSARIALGRTGISLPLHEVLNFKMAHAHARDAVFSLLDKEAILQKLDALRLPAINLQSCAVDRHLYLQRPDLGKRLSPESQQALKVFDKPAYNKNTYDVCICIADGLSAEAVNAHAIPVVTRLLESMQPYGWKLAPICIVEGGRVAISDKVGSLLGARLSLILIGERPGLSSANSMSAYLTYAPQTGLTDERRNCISNIRPEGLQYEEAAEKICYLIGEAFRLQLSGVALKDNMVAGLPGVTE